MSPTVALPVLRNSSPSAAVRDAGLLRELGHHARRIVDAGALDMVARVGPEQRRDAQARALGEHLHAVGELRGLLRRQRRAGADARIGAAAASRVDHVADDEAVHLLLVDERGHVGMQRTVAAAVERLDQHQPGLFLERHLCDEVGDARLDRAAPVLIEVWPAVAVRVLELQAVGHGQ
jgi:hypothetical protein